MERRVARDAGVVDQHLDRAEVGFDLLQARRACVVGSNVPLVDGDAGLGLELVRRLVVAGIACRDLVACGFQSLGDRRADAARSAGHHCHSGHVSLPAIFSSWPGLSRPSTSYVFISLKTWMPGTRPGMTQLRISVEWRTYRSTHIAMPMPPPMHSVARPFLASRFCISCSNVMSTRAPDAPIG